MSSIKSLDGRIYLNDRQIYGLAELNVINTPYAYRYIGLRAIPMSPYGFRIELIFKDGHKEEHFCKRMEWNDGILFIDK